MHKIRRILNILRILMHYLFSYPRNILLLNKPFNTLSPISKAIESDLKREDYNLSRIQKFMYTLLSVLYRKSCCCSADASLNTSNYMPSSFLIIIYNQEKYCMIKMCHHFFTQPCLVPRITLSLLYQIHRCIQICSQHFLRILPISFSSSFQVHAHFCCLSWFLSNSLISLSQHSVQNLTEVQLWPHDKLNMCCSTLVSAWSFFQSQTIMVADSHSGYKWVKSCY